MLCLNVVTRDAEQRHGATLPVITGVWPGVADYNQKTFSGAETAKASALRAEM